MIDRQKCSHCKTGGFEMIYQQNLQNPRQYCGLNLYVSGKKISNGAGPGLYLRVRSATPTSRSASARLPLASARSETPALVAQGDMSHSVVRHSNPLWVASSNYSRLTKKITKMQVGTRYRIKNLHTLLQLSKSSYTGYCNTHCSNIRVSAWRRLQNFLMCLLEILLDL